MKKNLAGLLFFVIIAAVLLMPAIASVGQRRGNGDRVYWQGKSSGFEIKWGAGDLEIKSAAGERSPIFSAQALAREGFNYYNTEKKRTPPATHCQYERFFQLLSVVGSMVSIYDDEASFCDNAPLMNLTYRYTTINLNKDGKIAYRYQNEEPTIDLDNPGKIMKLTEIFSDQEVLQRLLANPVIKTTLGELSAEKAPQSTAELYQLLDGKSIEINECSYHLRADFLYRFYFHHLSGNRVAVRIQLEPLRACVPSMAELGILLPIPETLKSALELAASRRQGILRKDIKKAAGNGVTNFSFSFNSSKRR